MSIRAVVKIKSIVALFLQTVVKFQTVLALFEKELYNKINRKVSTFAT